MLGFTIPLNLPLCIPTWGVRGIVCGVLGILLRGISSSISSVSIGDCESRPEKEFFLKTILIQSGEISHNIL